MLQRSKRRLAIFVILASMALAGGALMRAEMPGYDASRLAVEKLSIVTASGQKIDFDVEVAEKPIDQQIGLMFRKSMAPDHGMIFVMPEVRETSFWMKNTLIPLDMLFVDDKGVIVNIHRMAEPENITPIPSGVAVKAVIEINGGTADKTGIKIGDKVTFRLFQ